MHVQNVLGWLEGMTVLNATKFLGGFLSPNSGPSKIGRHTSFVLNDFNRAAALAEISENREESLGVASWQAGDPIDPPLWV